MDVAHVCIDTETLVRYVYNEYNKTVFYVLLCNVPAVLN